MTSDTIVTLALRVAEHQPPPTARSRAPYRVLCDDGNGNDVMLVYFHTQPAHMEKLLPAGAQRWVSGRIERWDGRWQMVHPDRVMDERGLKDLRAIDPVYPATEGLTQRLIGKATLSALSRVPAMPEWIEPHYFARQAFPTFRAALEALHNPDTLDALDPMNGARRRLAYDELLASQLALVMVRSRMRETSGHALVGNGALVAKILAALPYSLTESQRQAVADIQADLAAPKRMLRLLQGDVGSGKTIVGLLAMAHAIEAGKQAALMAPTEILARQHFERLKPLAEQAGLRIALLTGRDKAQHRASVRQDLASGNIAIAIGTHALFQDDVVFADLGIAVVDEQHRFGVHQRLALGGKGAETDSLVMTATPIPRTLVLTYFGDIELSILREKPAGRQPIATRVIDLERMVEVIDGIRRAIHAGAQIYWVCPLVAESEKLDIAAAQ
ncbi:MAG: ATP-dependent DNA helicase RecG, partial [Beijerinckiaceae bacterium]